MLPGREDKREGKRKEEEQGIMWMGGYLRNVNAAVLERAGFVFSRCAPKVLAMLSATIVNASAPACLNEADSL